MRTRTASPGLAAVMVVFTLLGCSSDGHRPGLPTAHPSVTSTAGPDPGIVRYTDVTKNYCDEAALYRIPTEFDLYVPELDEFYAGTYTDSAPAAWQASCTFTARDAADRAKFAMRGHVDVTVFADPAVAREAHSQSRTVWQERPSQFPVVEQLTSWWSDGVYAYGVEEEPERFRDRHLALDYRILHDNLLLAVDMGADFTHGDTEQVLSMAHEVARALIDAAAEHVPLAD